MALAGSGGRRRAPGRQRWRPAGSVALLAALVLAACGGDGDDGGEGDGESGVVTAWFNDETIPADEFAALEEEHGVVVEWDVRGDAVLTDLLRMRDAGQDLPDLVEIDSNLVPAFLEAELLSPMTEQIAAFEEEEPDLYATVLPSVWEDGTVDGEIYHWPNKSLVNVLFYNVSLLEDAGVEPPPYDTYWDFLDVVREVQEAIPDLPAYYGTGGTSPDRVFRWFYGFGVPFEGNVPDLTSEQGVEVIDFLQTMHTEGITDPEFMIGQQDESLGAFVSGDMPFVDEGLNGGAALDLDDFRYGEDWLTAPAPIHVDSGGQHIGAPRGWSMTSDAAQPDEAALVVRYLADPEIAAERYFELESGVPQSIPVLEGERMAEEQPFFTPELLEDFSSLEANIPPGTNTDAVGEVLNDMLEELTVTGTDDSPEEVAERYQPMLDELR